MIQVMLLCDRRGCPAIDYQFVAQYGWPLDADDIEMPEGWGLDQNGTDMVLHCPEHRAV